MKCACGRRKESCKRFFTFHAVDNNGDPVGEKPLLGRVMTSCKAEETSNILQNRIRTGQTVMFI